MVRLCVRAYEPTAAQRSSSLSWLSALIPSWRQMEQKVFWCAVYSLRVLARREKLA